MQQDKVRPSTTMNKIVAILSTIFVASIVAGLYFYAKTQGVDVLEPQGYISSHQRDLFVIALSLGLAALIPVFIMTFLIIQRYHTGNKKAEARYSFNWQIKSEASWLWAIFVSIIILTLAIILVKSTIAVDPYKPLTTERPSKVVRVVALPWKWLFIYPEENIASVNELAIPINQPIAFELTADAPMSSFWIPKLGGMIYTMQGMVTKLNLMATSSGEFEGKNAEINGRGYSGMKFTTKALSEEDYLDWVTQVRQSSQILDNASYQQLAQPSTNNSVQLYARTNQAIFGQIISKFMDHSSVSGSSHTDHQTH